jgi:hypothetical protein
MTSDTSWQFGQAFGVSDDDWPDQPAEDGIRHLHVSPVSHGDRSARWLAAAMLALGVLAAAAAVVSFEAQYTMVYAAKGNSAIAGLEAAIPDAAAIVFASLGIALALHGKRAVRARVLNIGAVATSVTMNALAAGPGWRNWAIWIMPPVAYALASDTLIGVVRAHAIAQQQEADETLADDEKTPLAVLAGVLMWLLRLGLAPASTFGGFRGWVLDECPVAPGRCAVPFIQPAGLTAEIGNSPHRERLPRSESKTSRLYGLVEDRYGPLATIDPAKVSRICAELAPKVDLNIGSARAALLPKVRAAQNGHSS